MANILVNHLVRKQDLAISRCGVAPKEYVDYQLALHSMLSSHLEGHRLISCLYPAMGPDIITPLLVLNAELIEGVDYSSWDFSKLREGLANPDVGVRPDTLELRHISGFWREDHQTESGWLSQFIMECRALKLDFNSIDAKKVTDSCLRLKFLWQHPHDNSPKERILLLNHGQLIEQWLLSTSDKVQYSACLQKGLNRVPRNLPKLAGNLCNLVSAGGILVDSTRYDSYDNLLMTNFKVAGNSEVLQEVKKTARTLNLEKRLTQRHPLFAYGYGWKLQPYIKNNEN